MRIPASSNLREVLEDWVNDQSLKGYVYHTVTSSPLALQGSWAISHEDAAANIDVLAERLENVLRDLQRLEVAEG